MSNIFTLARKFLLKLGQDPESDRLLKKHLGPEEKLRDPILKEMIVHDIIPIISERPNGQYSAELGSGAFNVVYEVSYKGRLAVAKVSSNLADYNAMLKLNELKKQLGADSKYIATVLNHLIIGNRYVVIVEKLEPLNSHLQQILFNIPYYATHSTKFLGLQDEYDYLEIIENMHKLMKEKYDFRSLDEDIKLKLLEKLDLAFIGAFKTTKNIDEFERKFINSQIEITSTLCTLIRAKPRNGPVKDDRFGSDCDRVAQLCRDYRNDLSSQMALHTSFPTYYAPEKNKTIESFLSKPETKGFLEFLYRLNKEFNIKWSDLHSANIMIRPGTGDLVISDPGLFQF